MTIFISFFLAFSLQLSDGLVVLAVLDLRHTTYNGWEKAFNLAWRTYLGINRDLHRCCLHIPCHPWYRRPGLVQKWRRNFEGQYKRSEYVCIAFFYCTQLNIMLKVFNNLNEFLTYWVWYLVSVGTLLDVSINICCSQWEKNV